MSDESEKKKTEVVDAGKIAEKEMKGQAERDKAGSEQRAANRLEGANSGANREAQSESKNFEKQNGKETAATAKTEQVAADRLSSERSKPTESQAIKDQVRLGDLDNRNLEINYERKQLNKELSALKEERATLERERKYIEQNPVNAQEKPPREFQTKEDRSTHSQALADQARLGEIRNRMPEIAEREKKIESDLKKLDAEKEKNDAERRHLERKARLNG